MSTWRLIAAGTLLIFLFIAGALALWLRPSRLRPLPSQVETAQLTPLSDAESRVVVPLSIPLAFVEEAVRSALPERVTGSSGSGFGRRSWDLGYTSRPQVSAVGGRARIQGALAGPVSSALLNLNAEMEVSTDIAVRFGEGGSLVLDPSTTVDLELVALGVDVGSGLESELATMVDDAVASQADALSDDFAQMIQGAWARMCTKLLVEPDAGVELASEPQRALIAQPVIGPEGIDIEVGIATRATLGFDLPDPTCAAVPETGIVADLDEVIDLVLPIEIGYERLDAALAERFAGSRLGEAVVAEIVSIKVRPYGQALLLEIDAAVTENWLGNRARGLVYVVGEPVVDVEEQALRLARVRMHAQSGGVLMTLFAKFGGSALEAETLALDPIMEDMRQEATTAMGAIDVGPVRLEGDIDRVAVERVDVGPTGIRAVLRARGSVSSRMLRTRE